MLNLSREGCLARRAALLNALEVDLVVISNPRHIQYFSGLYVTPLALRGWGPNALLIDGSTGNTTLLSHNFMARDAAYAYVDNVEIWTWYGTGNPAPSMHSYGLVQLNQRLSLYSGKRIAAESGWLPAGSAVERFTDVTPVIERMRRTKYPDELALIRQAIRAIEAGHAAAREVIRPGITELDVFVAMQTAIQKQVGAAVQMMGDFVSGERAFQIGGEATERVLQSGEVMILDVFPVINGYRADFTATVSVDGQPTEQQQALDTALHAAMAAAEALLRPGATTRDIYNTVHNTLAEHGFGDAFPHHAGHGLGLGHPEAPFLVPNSDEVLQAGDVITLEPGAYGNGFGARIEHNYLITEQGYERLTNHKTTLV